jgi:hypothetical protein
MVRQRRYHIEELRDFLVVLKNDAALLYQYGNVGRTLNLFAELTEADKKRLVAVALLAGDRDITSVARHLMTRLSPAPADQDQLFGQLTVEDRKEAETVFQVGMLKAMTTEEGAIIEREVHKAIGALQGLKLESAVWVLLKPNNATDSEWIDASGGGPSATGLRLANAFLYNPDPAERAELFTLMRNATWVLHFHNHPEKIAWASDADQEFARYWKAQRPELSSKMKFFIISGNEAVMYDERDKIGAKYWKGAVL